MLILVRINELFFRITIIISITKHDKRNESCCTKVAPLVEQGITLN